MSNGPILSGLWEIVWSTGARRAGAAGIKVEDIDSQRMVIHTRHGKGAKDRDVHSHPSCSASGNLVADRTVQEVDSTEARLWAVISHSVPKTASASVSMNVRSSLFN